MSEIKAGKAYTIIKAPSFRPELQGRQLRPVDRNGQLTYGAVNPQKVMFATPDGGGLFFGPDEVEPV